MDGLEEKKKEKKRMSKKDLFENNDDLFGRPTIGDLFPDFNPPTKQTEEKEKENGNEEAK